MKIKQQTQKDNFSLFSGCCFPTLLPTWRCRPKQGTSIHLRRLPSSVRNVNKQHGETYIIYHVYIYTYDYICVYSVYMYICQSPKHICRTSSNQTGIQSSTLPNPLWFKVESSKFYLHIRILAFQQEISQTYPNWIWRFVQNINIRKAGKQSYLGLPPIFKRVQKWCIYNHSGFSSLLCLMFTGRYLWLWPFHNSLAPKNPQIPKAEHVNNFYASRMPKFAEKFAPKVVQTLS